MLTIDESLRCFSPSLSHNSKGSKYSDINSLFLSSKTNGSKRSVSFSFNIGNIKSPKRKRRKIHHHKLTDNNKKNICNKLSLSNNQKIANILISSYIHQNISKKLNVPKEIKSICSNFYGLSYFLDSSIINKNEAKILTNLLLSKLSKTAHKTGNKIANNIIFDLLYRHSRSILDNKQYDKVCNGKTNIIVLIKSNYNKIFGGYTSSFIYDENNKANYNNDTNSFLFTINNSVQNSNIFPIKPEHSNYATYNNPNGPVFGQDFDIYLNGNNSFCKPQSYQIINASKLCGKDIRRINPNILIHTHYFKIIDYEIYQIKLI